MLDHLDRKEVIDYVVDKVVDRVQPNFNNNDLQRYDISLQGLSVAVFVRKNGDDSGIEITPFTDGVFRDVYLGSYEGLQYILREGSRDTERRTPSLDTGWRMVASTTSDAERTRIITEEEKEEFDRLLLTVKEQL